MFRTVRHVAMSPGIGFHCLSNTGINHPAKANTKDYCKICSKHLTFQWDPCKVTQKESSVFFIATKKIRDLDHIQTWWFVPTKKGRASHRKTRCWACQRQVPMAYWSSRSSIILTTKNNNTNTVGINASCYNPMTRTHVLQNLILKHVCVSVCFWAFRTAHRSYFS